MARGKKERLGFTVLEVRYGDRPGHVIRYSLVKSACGMSAGISSKELDMICNVTTCQGTREVTVNGSNYYSTEVKSAKGVVSDSTFRIRWKGGCPWDWRQRIAITHLAVHAIFGRVPDVVRRIEDSEARVAQPRVATPVRKAGNLGKLRGLRRK